jgi:hypothetical protein
MKLKTEDQAKSAKKSVYGLSSLTHSNLQLSSNKVIHHIQKQRQKDDNNRRRKK